MITIAPILHADTYAELKVFNSVATKIHRYKNFLQKLISVWLLGLARVTVLYNSPCLVNAYVIPQILSRVSLTH